jgi:hypothetical protein
MMVVTDRNRRWAVFDNLVKGSFNTRLDSLKSLLELCSVDRVVVEHVMWVLDQPKVSCEA